MHSQLHCKLIDELIINVQFLEFINIFLTTLRHLLSVHRSQNTPSIVYYFPIKPTSRALDSFYDRQRSIEVY